jgi:hypothetical protein
VKALSANPSTAKRKKKKIQNWAGGMAQVVENLPGKVLNSNSSTAKNF